MNARPRRLSEVRFHGGKVLFLIDLNFEAGLAAEAARLGAGLDRHLAEVFYWGADFCLDLGWYGTCGLADGHYPDGEFILRLRAGQLTLREWRTRDLLQLRRCVLQACDRAALLHPRRDLPTTLLELHGDSAVLAAEAEALLAACLPGRHIVQRRAWHVSGDQLFWTVLPPLDLDEAEATCTALQQWLVERRGRQTCVHSGDHVCAQCGVLADIQALESWRQRLRRSDTSG